jgi:hypothetical protein
MEVIRKVRSLWPYTVSFYGFFRHFRSVFKMRGRSTAEAVTRWLPTTAARVRALVWQVVFVVDKVSSGQVFSKYFGFPYQNRSFHQLLHPHNHPGQLAESLRRNGKFHGGSQGPKLGCRAKNKKNSKLGRPLLSRLDADLSPRSPGFRPVNFM